MTTQQRTHEQVLEHYKIEKALAACLRTGTAEERRTLYGDLYDELYRRVPDHPQLTNKSKPGSASDTIDREWQFLRGYVSTDTTYLEVGPGDCRLTFEVAKHVRKAIGVDVSATITSSDRRPPNFQLVLTDGTSIPVPPGSVDVAFSNQLMEHLHPDDAREQLVNLVRALRPGGKYICITPNRLTGPHDISRGFDDVATGFHLREYTNTELIALFRECGFDHIEIHSSIRGHSFRVPTGALLAFERWLIRQPAARRRALMSRPLLAKVLNNCRLVAVKA